jgi:hypothetical protein
MTAEDKIKNRKNIQIKSESERPREQVIADLILSGLMNSTEIILTYNPAEQLDGTEALLSLSRKAKNIGKGETWEMEQMLVSQAVALDAVFTRLSLRAHGNFGEYIKAGETYLRLALKAQSQCRATLETLAEIKNPRPYIQNNRAEYQQVNNGTGSNPKTNTPAHAHAGKTFSTNELLEDKTNEQEWLDTRTPTEAIRSD